MKNNLKQAFTLVELIVVITILAVLATIGFISMTSYSVSSRDAVRLTDLKSITKAFEFQKTKDIKLPLPDKKVDISASGSIFQHQGILSENILAQNNIHGGGKDPQTGEYFGYAVNKNRDKFQIITFLENEENVVKNNVISEIYADNSNKFPKTSGDKLGIILDETTKKIILDENELLEVDVVNTTNNYIVVTNNKNNLLTEGGLGLIIKNSSCQALKENNASLESGEYTIYPDGKEGLTVYCDMVTQGGGWTGLYYKDGSQTCENFGNSYNVKQIKNLNFSDFGVSDSLNSLGVDQSWIIRDVEVENDELFFDKLGNLANCTTPIGTTWSQTYVSGYLFYGGIFDTFGSWSEMNNGCHSTWQIGSKISIRSGGGSSHPGEFIHSACNAYNYENNSITSRWNDDNTRMFWVK